MTTVTIDAEALQRIVAEAQRGDRQAADRLIREHDRWVRSAIFAVTGRSDAVDDIAQRVWTRAWRRLGTLDQPTKLRPWLYAIARNTALDEIARRSTRAPQTPLAEAVVEDRRYEPSLTMSRSEEHRRVLAAIRALPAEYREPLALRHLEDWSYAEIGDVLGLSREAVETRLVRARRMLREWLQDQGEC